MKILLIGSSSDIARKLVENTISEFEFIELTSTPTLTNQHQIVLKIYATLIFKEVNGYSLPTNKSKTFSSLKLRIFRKIMKLMCGFDKNIETLSNNCPRIHLQIYQFCRCIYWHALSRLNFDV